MELIDRKPLIEKLKNAIALGHKIETFVGELEAVLEDVENMPIIDAVSVVRCKNCKYCHYEQEGDIFHCDVTSHRFYFDNHYCSYGERKDHE